MKLLCEQVPAKKVCGVRTLHVRPRVHDDVPGASGGRIGGVADGRFRVGVPLAVGDHLVQRQGDVANLLAAPDVDVGGVLRVGLKPGDDELDGHAVGVTAAGLGEGDTEAVPPGPPQAEADTASTTSATHPFKPAVSPQICSKRYTCRLLDAYRP